MLLSSCESLKAMNANRFLFRPHFAVIALSLHETALLPILADYYYSALGPGLRLCLQENRNAKRVCVEKRTASQG